MIVILSKSASPRDKVLIHIYLKDRGYNVREQSLGEDTIIGAFGKGAADIRELSILPGVERVAATSKPYELASRETKSEDTIVTVGGGSVPAVKIGGSR
ncbi:MAG: phospho-2-dehydro-3-deoxyheptonate aldolase, partial [Treponema sp.]|nr:phospho-2-dehydro-3-deoxyheptonate aldolase [Treponema sp.]